MLSLAADAIVAIILIYNRSPCLVGKSLFLKIKYGEGSLWGKLSRDEWISHGEENRNELRAQSLTPASGRTLASPHHQRLYQQPLPMVHWAERRHRGNSTGELGERRTWGRKLTAQAGFPGAAPRLQNEHRFLTTFKRMSPPDGHMAWPPLCAPFSTSQLGPGHLRLQGSALRMN